MIYRYKRYKFYSKKGLILIKKNSMFKLDLLILSILKRSDNYGYGISLIIREESDEVINIKEGVMYPILYKLLKDNMISNYDVVVNNRVRVYYKIEEAGLKELANLRSEFTKSVDIINRIISTK